MVAHPDGDGSVALRIAADLCVIVRRSAVYLYLILTKLHLEPIYG